ncbi:MAG: MlaD family protein [Verrucomicrobiota bacterium]
MQHTSIAIRVGIFFLLGVTLLWIMYETLSDPKVYHKDGYTVIARFADLRELKASDEVRMAGVRIGNVIETDLIDGKAVAVLLIKPKYSIPVDSEATILTTGIIGTNYVGITYGKSPEILAPASDITTYDTPGFAKVVSEIGKIGRQMDEAFAKLDQSLSVFAGDGTEDSVFVNLNNLINENRDRLNTTLTNLEQLSTELADQQGTLGKLIADDEAYQRILTATDNLTTVSDEASVFLRQLQSTDTALGALIYDPTLGEAVRTSFTNIEEFTIKLNSPSHTLGRILEDDALYLQTRETLEEVDDAVEQFSGGNVGGAAGALSNGLF